jgi:pyruvate,orthophosphate dikinase
VGCGEIEFDPKARTVKIGSQEFAEGAWVTLDGSTGRIFEGNLPTEPVRWSSSAKAIFGWADEATSIQVLANADTEDQALLARDLGAQGIGLCRTEHMFFDKERIHQFRLMILADDESSVQKLSIYQEDDFFKIFTAMKDLSVCVRLLDPPLHEFLPREEQKDELSLLAKNLNWPEEKLRNRIAQLQETNPMLGHRGCRLGVTMPRLYEMQTRALARAMVRLWNTNHRIILKVMIPLVMNPQELKVLLASLKKAFSDELELQFSDLGVLKKILKYVKWGTMIELPRACVVADQLAGMVDFFSFGTNDLTQTTLGLSRDDSARFIPAYIEKGLIKADPFESLDQEGVGQLIKLAVERGRIGHKQLDIGICGEHGGDPESIKFFRGLQFDSVSCSPFRVPMARLALAKAELALQKKEKR